MPWALTNSLLAREPYKSELSVDIEMIPRQVSTLTGKEIKDIFASECVLYEKYHEDPDKTATLTTYLVGIHYFGAAVDVNALRKLGFTKDDAEHLRGHLDRFDLDLRDRELRNSRTWMEGIRYVRVTYSSAPRAEAVFNVGTQNGCRLTDQQIQGLNELRTVVLSAAACRQ